MSSAARERHNQKFLSGGGEMGALIRAFDWSSTALGPPETWPQALRTSVRILLSTGHPMFIFWGPELIQFYNDAYRRSIGPERHPTALGQRGRECWEEIWHIIGPQIDQVMAGDGFTWHENQLVPITRHGKREDVYWTYSYGPIDDPSAPNGVGGVLVVCTETTEHVLAKHQLEKAEAAWRSLFDQAPAFMAITRGPRHTFDYANLRFLELLDRGDVTGKTIVKAIPEVEQQGFIELLDSVFRTGEIYSARETPFTISRPDGTKRRLYSDFIYQPICDEAGEVTGILILGFDVTQRVMVTEALRSEDRRKNEFLAILSHELRNPLAAIASSCEFLKLANEEGSENHEMAATIGRQTTQLSRLVDDLLDVNRISTGQIPIRQENCNLAQVLELAIESVDSFRRQKQQEFCISSAPDTYVSADASRLAQAFSNVLHNAIKFSPIGASISIDLDSNESLAELRVCDTGRGIEPEMLPRVFDLFAQESQTKERNPGGLGIGMALVKHIVDCHDGAVHIASEGRSKGCRVTITLPLVEAPAQSISDTRPAGEIGQRILVVDDNVDAANSLALLLNALGYRAEAIHSAKEALAHPCEVDIILLDIGLPVMSGHEVAKRLRMRGYEKLIVAVTGYGHASDIQASMDAGFDAHLTKPVDIDSLRAALSSAAGASS